MATVKKNKYKVIAFSNTNGMAIVKKLKQMLKHNYVEKDTIIQCTNVRMTESARKWIRVEFQGLTELALNQNKKKAVKKSNKKNDDIISLDDE